MTWVDWWVKWWLWCLVVWSVAFVAIVVGIATKRPDLVRRWEIWTQRPQTRLWLRRVQAGILIVGLVTALILGWLVERGVVP